MKRRFLRFGGDTGPGATVDLDGATVYRPDGDERPLTPTQLCLLEVLVAHRGGCVSRAELVAEGVGDPAGTVKDVRDALGEDRGSPQYLVTRPGVGYRLAGVSFLVRRVAADPWEAQEGPDRGEKEE